MSDFGTIILDRGIFKHPAFPDEPFTAREAWVWMIVSAAQRAGERRVGRFVVPLDRGQLAYSNRFMAERWKWSISKVQRFLARLATPSLAMIAQEVTESGVTRVTILNYAKFNGTYVTEFTVAEPKATPVTECHTESKTESQVNRHTPVATDCNDDKKQNMPPPPESRTGSDLNQITENKTTDSESVVVGGVARAREGKYITEEAFHLANEIMLTFGIDLEFVPPGWCGAPMWLQAGLNSGWRPEIVRVAAAKIRARKNFQPPYSFTYLAKPIAREHEIWATPNLPLPPVAVTENQDVSHAQTQPAGDWKQRRDNKHQAFADFRAANQAERERGGPDGDGNVVRMVPDAGRRR